MTLIFFALLFFVLGSCVGSFSSVLMNENIKHSSFWSRRSHCAECGKTLTWYELIPLVSYMVQWGKCRGCGTAIPGWIFRIELLMGIIWMLFGTLFVSVGFPTAIIAIHLILLSCLVILAVEDMRTLVIPDRLTLPMILIAFMGVSYARLYHNPDLLPLVRWSLIGGLVGMVFYSLQMVTPAIIHEVKHKHFSHIPGIILTPFFFPFWIMVKIFFWEKVADNIMPSMSRIATLPTWVSGGDIRLGILVGMIMGPVYFFWAVGIGYCVGALIFLIVDLFTKKHQEEIPVAPLLLIWVCGTWLMLLVTNSPVMGF